ncbi:GltB/FmdC/FwdC-like GXGXG domain-containing protein [Corynebacterium camporealensis]
MTGGKVVILGEIGENFGAGMSGGIAYIQNSPELESRLNKDVANGIEELDDDDIEFLSKTIAEHITRTGSRTKASPTDMVKIVPAPFRRVLDVIEEARKDNRDENEAIMEAVK